LSDIFREIDEELRRENWLKLWQRYGKYAIVAVVALVAGTAVFAGWRQYTARQRQAEGVRYEAALDLERAGKDKEAQSAFAAIAQGGDAGRAILARFEEAALDAKAKNDAGAAAIYDAISQDGSVQREYRDLATLLAGRLEVDKNPKAAAQKVAPLTDAQNPWHASALELTAIAALNEGDKTTARKTYQRLADDLKAPAGLRARAAEMVAALGQ
jgi:hypothetical protein